MGYTAASGTALGNFAMGRSHRDPQILILPVYRKAREAVFEIAREKIRIMGATGHARQRS